MSFLKRLFGGRPAPEAPPAPQPAPAPRPSRPGLFGTSPLHQWLDEAGLPWRETRGEIEGRHGLEVDPAYDWTVLPMPTTAAALPGLIRPFSARVGDELAPQHPPTEFSATTWGSDDAKANIQQAFDALASRLGKARIARRANTLHAGWTFGPAALDLTVWPDELQTFAANVPAHSQDPRLASACHVHVRTGWRLLLNAEEAAGLESFRPLAPAPGKPRTLAQLRNGQAAESELEFVREPPPAPGAWLGSVGVSGDGAHLIWTAGQLYVAPVAEVLGLEVHRLLPAKGGGGSWLTVDLQSACPHRTVKSVTLASADGPDDLIAPSRRLAEALGRPLTIGEPSYDV